VGSGREMVAEALRFNKLSILLDKAVSGERVIICVERGGIKTKKKQD
jgi:hypothetical protein